MIAAVILASGASRRLGRPKQLVTLNGETLIRRTVDTTIQAALRPVAVVVNTLELANPLQSTGAFVLLNTRYLEGIASSIHLGVQWADATGASGVVLMACDQPALTASHLISLIAHPDEMTGSGYADTVGIPAYFPRAMFHSLMEFKGDAGARNLLRQARAVVAEGLHLDIDTEEDLARARQLFG